ncbi:MAG: restriction endonuclease subunit S [Candidatus Thiodiazotropha sp.]
MSCNEWPIVTIESIASDRPSSIAIGPFGSRLKADKYIEVGVPVIRGSNLAGGLGFGGEWVYVSNETADSMPGCVVTEGDLVFPHRGAIGEVGLVDSKFERYLLSTSLMKLTCDPDQADPYYLYYFFKSDIGRHKLLMNASQVGTPGIGQPLSTLRSIELKLPPVSTQKAITDVLLSIDKKIANNCALAADLEAMARTIFKSWFVSFDPVKAKRDGRIPVGVNADTAALFPDNLVEKESGFIPKGWTTGTLADVSELNPESWSARNHPDAIRYADLAGTDRGRLTEIKNHAWTDAPSRARRVLRPGDTIIGTVRPGNRAYAYIGEDGLTGSTGFAILRPNSSFQSSYVYLAATSDEAIERLSNLADGAAYPAVRPNVVSATPLVMPPEDILGRFSGLTQPLIDRIIEAYQECDELAQVRDTLLPRLISGTIHLPEVQEQIEEAVA